MRHSMKITIFSGLNNYMPKSMEKYKYNLIKFFQEQDSSNVFYEASMDAVNCIFLKGIINRYILYSLFARNHFSEINFVLDHPNACVLNLIPKNTLNVVTCHDLIPLKNQGWNLRLIPFKLLSVRGLKKADMIITVSNNSKKDLSNILKIPNEKICVVYNGVDHKIFKPQVKPDAKKNIGFPQNCKIILHVGSEERRKNVDIIIKAFHILQKKIPNILLVRVGEKSKEISELIKYYNLDSKIKYLNGLSENELASLYNAADIFVFPSLYEGFGLPPLEAMACGCPVITSNTSSLPEVVGDAGIMVDPYDVDILASMMDKVLNDKNLRESMVQKGIERSSMFSWDKCAVETLNVLKKVSILNSD